MFEPGPPDLVGADRRDLRPARRGAARGGGPGHRDRRGHRARPRRRPGLRPGTPVVGRRGRHPARPARDRRAGRSVHGASAARSGSTRCWSTDAAHRPGGRLRTLCHAAPDEWMVEGIGFYCGPGDAVVPRRVLRRREAAAARGRGVDAYVVMEEARGAIPPGSNGVLAILSNLMNANRWVHASPVVRPLRPGPPGRDRAHGVRARDRGERPRTSSAGTWASSRADRPRGSTSVVQPAARPRARCGPRSSPTCSALAGPRSGGHESRARSARRCAPAGRRASTPA